VTVADIRALAAVLLAGAAALFGQALGGRALARGRDVRALAQALAVLATEVGYTATPLPLALERAGRATGGRVGDLLGEMAERLARGAGSAETVWREALAAYGERYVLPEAALGFVHELAPALGRSDRQDQVAHLRRVARHLEALADRMTPECEKNARLSRTLGLLGGLAVAILVL